MANVELSVMDMERLADLILRKMEHRFLRMPEEFRRRVQKGFMLPTITIPLDSVVARNERDEHLEMGHSYYMEMYITHMGGLMFRIRDEFGVQLMERTFV